MRFRFRGFNSYLKFSLGFSWEEKVKHNLDNGYPLKVHTFGKIMVSMQQSEKLITPLCHLCSFYFYSIKYSKLTSMC